MIQMLVSVRIVMMKNFINQLASLQVTLAGLFVFALGLAVISLEYNNATLAISPGFAILLVNLICAILIKEKINRNPALLIFHLSLLSLMCLIIASRLTYMKGWLQVNEGEKFTQMSGILHQGIFHSNPLQTLNFQQLNFKTTIQDGRRIKTQSFIRQAQSEKPFIIQDQTPMTIGAYQFTLSSHIGYSLLLNWQSDFNYVEGSIKLPAYSRYRILSQTWTIPNTELELELHLEMDNQSEMRGHFKQLKDYQLLIFYQNREIILKKGESYQFEQGRLSFYGLKRWIGYDVFYDWTIPWLLATCLLAIGSLALFLWQKNNSIKWDE